MEEPYSCENTLKLDLTDCLCISTFKLLSDYISNLFLLDGGEQHNT